MSKDELQKQIINVSAQLNEKELESVYQYLMNLINIHKKQGKELLKMVGTIPKDDLILMEEAINNGCEKIDTNDW